MNFDFSFYIRSLLCAFMSLCFATLVHAEDRAFKIMTYLSTAPDSKHVLIDAGRGAGIASGEIFRVVRPVKAGVATPVETGLLKIVVVRENDAIAEIIQQGTNLSRATLGIYSDIMAGDLAVAQRISIARAKSMVQELIVRYSQIFDDPKSQPSTYEFTTAGKNELKRIAAEFASLKTGMLMIEGHTDQKGGADPNQIESYQRALTVRQFFIEDLGFDESRVTAIGLGESEPISEVVLPGNADRSRRIVFKVVPMPGTN